MPQKPKSEIFGCLILGWMAGAVVCSGVVGIAAGSFWWAMATGAVLVTLLQGAVLARYWERWMG
jgi:hypothetical protein